VEQGGGQLNLPRSWWERPGWYESLFDHKKYGISRSNFYVAGLWSSIFFFFMIPAGYISFRFFEGPFLKLRKPYVIAPPISSEGAQALALK